ncbi:MAG: DUF6073 family protein [Pirellulaceae bacterium]|jgi:hypothetical protein|nr:DUF6073 family protein [Pirellulaceae bacterium]
MTGPSTVHVFFERNEGDADDDDGDGLDEVQTELVELNLTGTSSSLGSIEVRLNPNLSSLGEIEERQNNNAGRLDLDPFHTGNADSVFDVFFEIQIGDQVFFTDQPKRMHAQIRSKPPQLGDTYFSARRISLLDADGNDTGYSVGVSLHSFVSGTLTWQNPDNNADVNVDGSVTSNDALRVINELNSHQYSDANGRLPNADSTDDFPFIFFDVNGDGFVTPNDIVRILNILKMRNPAVAEGEGASLSVAIDWADGNPQFAPLLVWSELASGQTVNSDIVGTSSRAGYGVVRDQFDLVRPVRPDWNRPPATPRIKATDAALTRFDLLESPLDELLSELEGDSNEGSDRNLFDLALKAVLDEGSS